MRLASRFVFSTLVFGTTMLQSLPAESTQRAWIVRRDSWSSSDEKNYSAFIQAIGSSSQCNTVERCLKSSANPYRASDPAGVSWTADCGKFPYLLRGYFAWKNDLPFSYANRMVSADGDDSDLRYSRNGNVVASRRAFTARSSQSMDGVRALKLLMNEVLTAMFRVHPNRDAIERGTFPDFYSAHIDRDQVRPGTLVYDAAGHAVIVYKVETDGRVRYFDAHPDNTVSHGVYGKKFARSRPGAAAGFKNFRALRLVGYSKDRDGELVGGVITTTSLVKTPGFSTEQYWGTESAGQQPNDNWRKARFKANGVEMPFEDFVRARLAIGELKYKPVEEMENAIDALCNDFQDRVGAVQAAAGAGIYDKPHPYRLPTNIYGSSGEWEEYSTPSRDARLKTSFVEIRQRVEKMVDMYKAGDPRIDYKGNDLPGDLRASYAAKAKACSVVYKKSNGAPVQLDYDQLVGRLFAFSFDPYHCPELRWGARSEAELASCKDSLDKRSWFEAEQRLRNQIDRTYDIKMAFTLADLRNKVPGSGIDRAPDVDLRGYLQALK